MIVRASERVFAVLRAEGRDRESDFRRASGRLCELAQLPSEQRAKVMPDDHSEVVPLLPIPNRTVKRLCADDSADSRVKVGHRQAINSKGLRRISTEAFFFVF